MHSLSPLESWLSKTLYLSLGGVANDHNHISVEPDLITEHYHYTRPQLGPPENWPCNQDGLRFLKLLYFALYRHTHILLYKGCYDLVN